MVLVLVPIGIMALWFFAYGSALTSQNQSTAHTNWLGWVLHQVAVPFKVTINLAVQLSKTIAHWMWPALNYAEKQLSGYFTGLSKFGLYHANQAHRTIVALNNTLAYVTGPWALTQAAKAKAATEATVAHYFQTKAPTLPQRRITQKDVDIEFQRLIEANFAKQLGDKFPKWDWDPSQWKKWLGVLPALGGAVVTQPRQAPQPQPAPNPKPSPNPAENPATQPTTLPHTDDNPNPDPGTQVVPGVVSGKDKWARGQIVQLKKRENHRWSHLGPLALLALTPLAIKTLIGLVECKNVGRSLKKFCGAPGHLVDDFLALLADFFILTNICTILPWLEQGFNLIEPAIAEVTAGAAAIACSDGYDKPAALRVPTLHLPPSPSRLPVLNLP